MVVIATVIAIASLRDIHGIDQYCFDVTPLAKDQLKLAEGASSIVIELDGELIVEVRVARR